MIRATVLIALALATSPASAQTVGSFRFDDSEFLNYAIKADVVPESARDGAAADQQASAPPAPAHTGLKALVFETGSDFKAFPQRPSTWVILGVGGAVAALSHPLDDSLNSHIQGSRSVSRLFSAGKY